MPGPCGNRRTWKDLRRHRHPSGTGTYPDARPLEPERKAARPTNPGCGKDSGGPAIEFKEHTCESKIETPSSHHSTRVIPNALGYGHSRDILTHPGGEETEGQLEFVTGRTHA